MTRENAADENGHCETGDCGGLHCNGRGGAPPASLAEITVDAHKGLAFYDVSLVDGLQLVKQGSNYVCNRMKMNTNSKFAALLTSSGYNLPMSFGPYNTDEAKASGNGCGTPTCVHDLLSHCPDALKVKASDNGS